jgi:hypothetical protein
VCQRQQTLALHTGLPPLHYHIHMPGSFNLEKRHNDPQRGCRRQSNMTRRAQLLPLSIDPPSPGRMHSHNVINFPLYPQIGKL